MRKPVLASSPSSEVSGWRALGSTLGTLIDVCPTSKSSETKLITSSGQIRIYKWFSLVFQAYHFLVGKATRLQRSSWLTSWMPLLPTWPNWLTTGSPRTSWWWKMENHCGPNISYERRGRPGSCFGLRSSHRSIVLFGYQAKGRRTCLLQCSYLGHGFASCSIQNHPTSPRRYDLGPAHLFSLLICHAQQ